MTDAKTAKIYVRPDDTAIITCPHCSRQKTVPVAPYKGKKSLIKIKCGCKDVFNVTLEFRQRVRKKTSLSGIYVNHTRKSRGDMVVKNVSMGGLEFATMDLEKFNLDDELTVEFNLDDNQRSLITKDVIVRDIREKTIGCEFDQLAQVTQSGPLGFYLMA